MDQRHGFHRRLRRQDLDQIFGRASTPGSSSSGANPLDPGGIASELSVLFGGTSTTASSSPATTTTTTPTTLSSSSTSSTTAQTSGSPSASPTHTSTNTSTTPASATSTAIASSTAPDVVLTSSDGTSIVYVTSTPSASSATPATAVAAPSFLHNRPLESGVFALVGIVAVVLISVLVTWTIRKRNRDRLERDTADAVDFDPGMAGRYEQEVPIEKRRMSLSSSGDGHGYGFGYGYGVQPAYAPPQEYYNPAAYGPYPVVAYGPPPPNPVLYQEPSHTILQPTATGGANLTRKYSDRKPVPPLLPNPAYDPANAHVSIPPQFYPQ